MTTKRGTARRTTTGLSTPWPPAVRRLPNSAARSRVPLERCMRRLVNKWGSGVCWVTGRGWGCFGVFVIRYD